MMDQELLKAVGIFEGANVYWNFWKLSTGMNVEIKLKNAHIAMLDFRN